MIAALAAIAILIISGISGFAGAVVFMRTFVRHAPNWYRVEGRQVVTSPGTAFNQPPDLTHSESADPGTADALTGHLFHQVSPATPLTDSPIGLQSDWTCRWCEEQGPITARPQRLVLEEQAAHMRACHARPAQHRVQRPEELFARSGSFS